MDDLLKWLEDICAKAPPIEDDFDEGYQQAYEEVRNEVRGRLKRQRR